MDNLLDNQLQLLSLEDKGVDVPSLATHPSGPDYVQKRGKDPIFLFFTRLVDLSGDRNQAGHYCRYLSNHDTSPKPISVPTTTTSLPSCLVRNNSIEAIALQNHLHAHYPSALFELYRYLKYKSFEPSPYEIRMAHGGQDITPQVVKSYMETHSKGLPSFETRREDTKVLICKWLASADQKVMTTQSPPFRELFGPEMPSERELSRTAEDIADNIVLDTKQAIEHCSGQRVALSIHALTKPTSRCPEVVVSILVHYASPKGLIEQRVLGLRLMKAEVQRISDFVWVTMEQYKLVGKHLEVKDILDELSAITVDDTQQSDQLVEDIEQRLLSKGIKFAVKHSRLRCLHQTVRRAAAEFLRASNEPATTESRLCNTEDGIDVPNPLNKLRHIIRYIKSRPADEWREVANTLPQNLRALSLILDNEANPWPTTGKMIGRALYLQPTIESFARTHPAVKNYRLSDFEWQELAFVSVVMNHFVTAMDQIVLSGQSPHGSAGSATLSYLTNVPYRELLNVIKETSRDVAQTNSPFAYFLRPLAVSYEILRANYYPPLHVLSALFDPRTRLNGSTVAKSEIERESVVAADTHLRHLLREAHPAPHNYLQALHQLDQYQALPPIESHKADPVEWWNLNKGTVTAAERHALIYNETQTILGRYSVWELGERDKIIHPMTAIKHEGIE
ncbi:hypothetical protein V5O48_003334 [Marasmius crinis-equi]|uniref:Uncharacterized protein n=1 Tax=Marasmius crinis-equi TaxID=585013 RepID=A0ABR3FT51_9AGAR